MRRVLLIEDDPVVGQIFQLRFQLDGWQVERATDGQMGLAAIARSQPEVVLLDLMLPRLSGIEVLRKLRSQPQTKDLPVVVLTNHSTGREAAEAIQAGATNCLSKSDNPKAIAAAVMAAAAAAPAAAPAGPGSSEKDLLGSARKQFLAALPAAVQSARQHSQNCLKVESTEKQLEFVQGIARGVQALAAQAAAAKVEGMARLAEALGGFLDELQGQPQRMNASTLRTVHQGVEALARLSQSGPAMLGETGLETARVLVVDDEVMARRAIIHALEKGKLKSESFADPRSALEAATREIFELVITDVDMPGLNGFELCQQLRALPGYAGTPVIFVTVLNNFESRRRAAMKGASDFIAKPFLFLELTVKALGHLLENRSAQRSALFQSFRPKA